MDGVEGRPELNEPPELPRGTIQLWITLRMIGASKYVCAINITSGYHQKCGNKPAKE